jgi:signal transduction histidine kinase
MTWGSAVLRRTALDWLAPVVVLGIGVVDLHLHARSAQYPGSPALHLTFLVAAVAALGFRRRAPIAAPMLGFLIVTVWAAEMWPRNAQGPFEGFLLVVGAGYAIAAGNSGRRLVQGSAILFASFVVGQVAMFAFGGSVGDLLPVIVWITMAWIVGFLLNRRNEQARQARAHATALAADQARRTSEAVVAERSRIARELHDVVAHSLSVMVVQSAAERRAWRHGKADGSSTEAVLDSVERTGREALVDLRRLLGLLRQVDEVPTRAPQPTLRELDGLLEQMRRAGLAVSLHTEGAAFPLPAAVDLSAYRIVQEALTNVVKHADASRVEICLRYQPHHLQIDITDDGHGSSSNGLAGSGQGLVGMRERVAIYGGGLRAGPAPRGGWVVQARLPVSGSATLEPL